MPALKYHSYYSPKGLNKLKFNSGSQQSRDPVQRESLSAQSFPPSLVFCFPEDTQVRFRYHHTVPRFNIASMATLPVFTLIYT